MARKAGQHPGLVGRQSRMEEDSFDCLVRRGAEILVAEGMRVLEVRGRLTLLGQSCPGGCGAAAWRPIWVCRLFLVS